MRIACLVSGGKDSILAAMVARERGWDVEEFVTVIPEDSAPTLFHHPNASWVRLQAQAAGVRWRPIPMAHGADEEATLEAGLRGIPVEGIVAGALASEYQRTRFERVCHRLGLRSFAPLWHHAPSAHIRDVVGSGIEAWFSHVAANGLGPEWLGRRLDAAAIADLEQAAVRSRIHVAGEGGEYETFVTDAPLFGQRIVVDEASAAWRRDEGTWTVARAHLAAKKAA